jgi:rod shape-determining protein MreD
VIPTPGAVVRVGVLVFFAVILQITGVGEIRILGANANLIPLAVAAVALYAGAIPGAIAGFSAGLLIDLAVGVNLGSSSLVLTAVGYAVGRYREVRDPAHALAPIPVAILGTLGYSVGDAAVSFMLSSGASVSGLLIREMVLTALLNGLIALPAFWVARRLLRPVLVVDPAAVRRRRTRVGETGPIGLRGLGLGEGR